MYGTKIKFTNIKVHLTLNQNQAKNKVFNRQLSLQPRFSRDPKFKSWYSYDQGEIKTFLMHTIINNKNVI